MWTSKSTLRQAELIGMRWAHAHASHLQPLEPLLVGRLLQVSCSALRKKHVLTVTSLVRWSQHIQACGGSLCCVASSCRTLS